MSAPTNCRCLTAAPVIATLVEHRILWADPLSALAILAKCSDSIWLRAKTPSLSAALGPARGLAARPARFRRRLPKESA